MRHKKENPGVGLSRPVSQRARLRRLKKYIFVPALFFVLSAGLFAQTEFPSGDFWSLDAGAGMSGTMTEGSSFQAVLDPKLWLSPPLMVGSRLDASLATDGILTFDGQVYLRWNFLRLGNPRNTVNIFGQAGVGILASYRGDGQPFDNREKTRGSLLADAALGVTIPLGERWHIEPLVRGGYPHLWGFSVTAGYKFRLPQKTETQYVESPPQIVYQEVIKTLPPNEIIKRIMITSVEFTLFGPNIGDYNVGIDPDARELNELVLNETARLLKDNPDYRVRLEGHANPVTTDPNEKDELMVLSAMRSNAVASQLRARGVAEEQLVIIAFGGTRTLTSDHSHWDRNRRVELIVLQVDSGTN